MLRREQVNTRVEVIAVETEAEEEEAEKAGQVVIVVVVEKVAVPDAVATTGVVAQEETDKYF